MLIFLNVGGKSRTENAVNQHFSIFLQCLQSLLWVVKTKELLLKADKPIIDKHKRHHTKANERISCSDKYQTLYMANCEIAHV